VVVITGLDPVIHAFFSVLPVAALVTWMAGTSPAMTVIDCSCHHNARIGCIRINFKMLIIAK